MFKASFSWLETCLASFEVSDANALRYCSFMLLHDIIAIITNLISKVTYNTIRNLRKFRRKNLLLKVLIEYDDYVDVHKIIHIVPNYSFSTDL